MTLSFGERLILANQMRLLSAQGEEPSDFYDLAIRILEDGYEDHYDFVFQGAKPTPFSGRIAEEVRTILQMFSEMQWASESFPDDPICQSPIFQFWGFDHNNNTEHVQYARLLHDLGKFPEIGERLLYNSHSDTIETYRSMVRAWQQLPRKGLQMSKTDVEAILDAPKVENLPMPESETPQA